VPARPKDGGKNTTRKGKGGGIELFKARGSKKYMADHSGIRRNWSLSSEEKKYSTKRKGKGEVRKEKELGKFGRDNLRTSPIAPWIFEKGNHFGGRKEDT